jgi:hypothetical protein
MTDLVITEPCLLDDLPERIYLSDPVEGGSLSFSGAKALLPPSCPAKYRHQREHGRPPKATFDMGHAVHKLVLGAGEELVIVDAPTWQTKAAKEARAAAYAAGHTPLLTAEYERAQVAAKAVLEHDIAGELFALGGISERSLFWLDDKHDVWRRARLDRTRERNGRLLVVDLKTCQSVEPRAISKTVAEYRYYQQEPFYLDGVRALGLDPDPAFVFVFVEVNAPHLVTVCELDGAAVAAGDIENQRALELYAECTVTDVWPGYSDGDIPLISLPPWAPGLRDLETAE